MNKDRYAIWYSVLNDYERIMGNFTSSHNSCKFEQDFNLEDRFIDYEHTVMIWYGKSQGESGALSRQDNPTLEEGFDFITSEVSRLLGEKNISKISYLLAIPELEYHGEVTSNGVLEFAGYVRCTRPNSSWLDDILNEM